jgi:uncharacterized protein
MMLNKLPAAAVAVVLMAVAASAVTAQELRFFSIGTGGTGGTYYPLGGTIATAISNPPGSLPCDEGGSCGVAGLIAVAQASRGSVDNIEGILADRFQSGFVQSDVAYSAFAATALFADREPAEPLRAIAALYPEHIQLVARADAGIGSVAELAGKRVSLDERGSGSYVNALQILAAYGLSEGDLEPSYLKADPSSDEMIAGNLDAFFITSGYPTNAIIELGARIPIALVPIAGAQADALVEQFRFYSHDVVPAGTYPDVPETPTLAVGAQWVTRADVDNALVYEITRTLWLPETARLLSVGHAKGATVQLDTALAGIAIPLHSGAEQFYREVGLLD